MDKPDAPSKSIWYLFAAAVGWWMLAFLPVLLLFRTEYGKSRVVPLVGQGLLIEIAKLIGFAVVLFGDYIQGRIIGHGNVRTGLGDQPITPRPIVVLMAILIAAYAILWDVIHYVYFRDLVYQQFVIDESSPWLSLTHAFFSVLLAPLSEELFFAAGCGLGYENIGVPCRPGHSRARFGLRCTQSILGCGRFQSQ